MGNLGGFTEGHFHFAEPFGERAHFFREDKPPLFHISEVTRECFDFTEIV